jgi:phosphoglycolate phosphatase
LSDSISRAHRAIFFDLDGTLVDTALDMVGVLQALQQDRGLRPVDYELGRSQVSNGAIGLLRLGFPDVEGDAQDALRQEYLERYAHSVCERSALFDGFEALLKKLDDASVPWGVITNKPGYLTDALLEKLDLANRSACAISGDTLDVRKPNPGPLLHACKVSGVRPDESIYVGDSARDIEAGLAAGMGTIAAAYGYIVAGDDPAAWGAHQIAANVEELAQIILKAVNLSIS